MSVTTFDEARVCIESAFNSGASNTGPRLAQAIAHVAAYGDDLPECARLLIVASRYFYVLGKSIDGLKTARVAEAIADRKSVV